VSSTCFHHFALRERAGRLQQAVRQGRLAVVDVRNDREIADEFAIHAMWGCSVERLSHTGATLIHKMSRVYEGQLSAGDLRFAIIVSRFNSFITERLLGGAMDALTRTGANPDLIDVIKVPVRGSFRWWPSKWPARNVTTR